MNDINGAFYTGMIIMAIIMFGLFGTTNININKSDINLANELCKDNDGLVKIEWKVNKNEIYCVNGAVFETKGE